MNPHQLSRELRTYESRWLRHRRGIVGLSLTAAECMQLIGLYQMGLIRSLPDLPFRGFDADVVDASDEAYEKLSMPDAFLGLGSYAATVALAAMGGQDRARTRPWIPVALAAKTVADAVQAGKLSWDQWARHRAFCVWCLIAAGATFASVPLAMPEAWAAVKRLVAAK